MLRSVCWAALALILGAVGTAHGGEEPAPPTYGSALGRSIDAALQRKTDGGFWGAVLVARGGKVDLAKGYGNADLAQRPIDASTIFELASVSKQVTATAILRLEQQGKLKTTDTLATFWPKIPEDKREMQVQHLLNHTSGLAGSIGVPYHSPIDREAYVAHVLTKPRTHFPGDHFSYSNVGYALLAAIVEKVTGGTFEAYCAAELFKPARLTRTGFINDQRLLEDANVAVRMGGAATDTAVRWHWGWGYRGMGGVVTTLNDLLLWDRALRTDVLLNKGQRTKLFTPAEGGYACGWKIGPTAGGQVRASHSGSVKGFGVWLTHYRADDAMIAIWTNGRRDLGTLNALIEEALYPQPKVTAVVDATGLTLTKHRAALLGTGCSWQVIKERGQKRLHLNRDGKAIVRIVLPEGSEARIIAELGRAARARRADDPGKPASMDSDIYLNAYPGKSRIELTDKVTVTVMPLYRGRGPNGPTVDKRATLIIHDGTLRAWPLMVKMNLAATEALIEALR